MKTTLFLIFGALVCVSVNGQGDTPSPTTFAPPTPPPPTNATTTTTPAPTTPTTTTVAPTTAAPPTTTTPTPKFPANEGRWNVTTGNTVCIVMKGAIEASLTYVDVNKKNQVGNVDVPRNAIATGNCGGDVNVQSITLSWNKTVSANATQVNQLTFVFEANINKTNLDSQITSGKFALANVTGVIFKDEAAFPNATDRAPIKFELVNQDSFQTPLNYSYACLAEESLKSGDGAQIVKLKDIRFEAFKSSAAAEFSSPIDCPADDSSDVVPIAVGAALAGLVVIVLLAYLIGRRRSRARGYQSV